ncbi:MAG: DUF4390 domain-containing protein [Desulfobacterales bacterium]|nr:DUF4390 domain-containing protein [Desulfobacterales bacterium]MDX2513158.1 DUF4390 domain-containing protein [Desulfobacterales bacterium]
MMSFNKNKTMGILLCIAIMIQPTIAHANDAELKNIIVTNTQDDLLIYLTVEGAFRQEMETAISTGVPATFSFFVNLYQTRGFWFDKNISELKVLHTIKYDTLKNGYIVERSWDSNHQRVMESFDEAKKLMAEIDSLKIVELNRLEKGSQYQIRTKAQLNKLTLPFYLHYVLFFVSLWDFDTDWYTIDFIY